MHEHLMPKLPAKPLSEHDVSDRIPFIANPTQQQTKVLTNLLSGQSTFAALKQAVEELTPLAPKDSDVMIEAFDIIITKVILREPNTLIFRGFNNNGHDTFVVIHHTQLIAHIIHRPKIGNERVITGFAIQPQVA